MNITQKARINLIKWALIFSAILIVECSANAQSIKRFVKKYHFGIESAFGVKSFKMVSNIPQLDNIRIIEEGGTIGIVGSLDPFTFRLRHGYFYSSSNCSQTVDLVRSSVLANLYPLKFIHNKPVKIQPYLMAGVRREIYKMYGYYHPDLVDAKLNYSASEAPFLGSIKTNHFFLGTGVEYAMKNTDNFVKVFAEASHSMQIGGNKSDGFFSDTRFVKSLCVQIGVAFGYF